MNQIDIAEAAIALAHRDLWAAQLRFWPDSVELSVNKMLNLVGKIRSLRGQGLFLLSMVSAMQYPVRAFYRTPEGHIGCRYGLEGPEYISGFAVHGELPR